jgi:transcriptional regulator with XRE-family HTH domain
MNTWTAQRIRDLRTFLGWTQAQLADELLVRDATISGWENSKTTPRRMFQRALQRLAQRSGFEENTNGPSS